MSSPKYRPPYGHTRPYDASAGIGVWLSRLVVVAVVGVMVVYGLEFLGAMGF